VAIASSHALMWRHDVISYFSGNYCKEVKQMAGNRRRVTSKLVMLEMTHSLETNEDKLVIINESFKLGDSHPSKVGVVDPNLSIYGTIQAKQVKREPNNIEIVIQPGPPDPSDLSCKCMILRTCDFIIL